MQHVVCLLHLNELPLRHLFCEIDGVTNGPDSFKGKIGMEVSAEVWKEANVAFPTVKGKLPIISEEQLAEISRDQRLLYMLSHALDSGVVSDSVAGTTIGPLLHARWLTLACRIIRKAISAKKPTNSISTILQFLQCVYVPAWFLIKFSPYVQFGAGHIF